MPKKMKLFRGVFGFASLSVGLLLLGLSAAQLGPFATSESCSPRDRVVSGLDKLFGEIYRARAVAADDTLMEFFSSHRNKTWTLLRTLPDGRACVVATGRGDWMEAVPKVRTAAVEVEI
ncbi:hypothetical protein R3X27_21150 [Tropicimonas sp. TH_r6]|uniref:hypothetical protein n=1 Tax=Tropicimonas sp. TH_r6 TaxID=3082085 RepID=UPI002955C35C|nr:hypothetical protein [Tropicimonas sp. TH_r6]MDV7145198.1 hypothetical protein [Tropicimonas sp. TH_r6]